MLGRAFRISSRAEEGSRFRLYMRYAATIVELRPVREFSDVLRTKSKLH